MPTTQQFVARAQELTEGTPYAVTPTAQGCDIAIDIADARWFTLLAKEGLSKSFTFRVALDEQAGTMSVTDESRTVEWRAGADGEMQPSFSGSVERTSGRTYELSAQKVYAWGEDGQYGEQVGYAFSSGEGRALIKQIASEQGWTEQMNTNQKIGLYVALGVVAMLVVMGLIALVILL